MLSSRIILFIIPLSCASVAFNLQLAYLLIYNCLQVRRKFGCVDEVVEVEHRAVRHCNWVRFIQTTSNSDEVNMVARKVNDRPVFEIVRPIPSNGELKACFIDDLKEPVRSSPAKVAQVNSLPNRNSTGSSTTNPDESSEDESLSTPPEVAGALANSSHGKDKSEHTFTSPSSGFISPLELLQLTGSTPGCSDADKTTSNTPRSRPKEVMSSYFQATILFMSHAYMQACTCAENRANPE